MTAGRTAPLFRPAHHVGEVDLRLLSGVVELRNHAVGQHPGPVGFLADVWSAYS
ncbi:hypothetical protein [Streptomyces tuirus]